MGYCKIIQYRRFEDDDLQILGDHNKNSVGPRELTLEDANAIQDIAEKQDRVKAMPE